MEFTKSDREILVAAVVAVMFDDLGYSTTYGDEIILEAARSVRDKLGIRDISDVFAENTDRGKIMRKYLTMAVDEIIMPHTEKEVTDGVTA